MEYVYLICQCNYEYEMTLFYFDNEEDARKYVAEHSDVNDYWSDLKMYVKKVPKYK